MLITAANFKSLERIKPGGWGWQRIPWQDQHSGRVGWQWYRPAPEIITFICTWKTFMIGRKGKTFSSAIPIQLIHIANPINPYWRSIKNSPSWTRTPPPSHPPWLVFCLFMFEPYNNLKCVFSVVWPQYVVVLPWSSDGPGPQTVLPAESASGPPTRSH